MCIIIGSIICYFSNPYAPQNDYGINISQMDDRIGRLPRIPYSPPAEIIVINSEDEANEDD